MFWHFVVMNSSWYIDRVMKEKIQERYPQYKCLSGITVGHW